MAAQTSQLEQPDVSGGGDSVQRFVQWAIAELGLELTVAADGGCELVRTEETPKGVSRLAVFRWSADERLDTESGGQAVGDNRLVAWCAEELRAAGPIVHARPAQQPMGVHEISGRLFKAYTVDEGNVHLGGCRLEDRPFLRLSYAQDDRIVHRFFGHDGEPVDEDDIANLGLASVVPVGPYPPRIDDQQLTLLISAGRKSAEGQCPSGNGNGATQTNKPLATVLVWAKYVTGKLRFTIRDATADLPFGGWARTLKAPQYRCEASQTESFHLGATDDGRVVAAEQIAACAKSGKCVVRSELVTCSVTAKSVLAEFTETCPVSGMPTIRKEFAACDVCRQEVSRVVLEEGVCRGCRDVAPLPVDDPRIVWLLGEYPALDRFRRWLLSETATVYIIQASRMLKRFLIVVDKETIEVLRLAKRGWLSNQWTDLELAERSDLLE